VVQSIRQSEWEAKELSKVRKQVNEAVTLVTPYYDIMRVNANESDDDEEEVQEQQLDYLSPFLPKTPGTRGLLREEALKVREACLKALRDRLIERANIIQACFLQIAAEIWQPCGGISSMPICAPSLAVKVDDVKSMEM
jgi:hypothetical protein